MADKKYYTIGEVEKICGVTQRMLRYYEKQDLVVPDKINPDNHYRYYTSETMRRIQGIRYLIDTGFSLDDIRNSALSGDRNAFRDMFVRKEEETCKEIDYYYRRLEGLHE